MLELKFYESEILFDLFVTITPEPKTMPETL